jgi:hypothetical protein
MKKSISSIVEALDAAGTVMERFRTYLSCAVTLLELFPILTVKSCYVRSRFFPRWHECAGNWRSEELDACCRIMLAITARIADVVIARGIPPTSLSIR